ncbi:uncharacterized protein LOC110615960 [Manihot esculenta]|uniref:Thioesterase domain-containing protein n=1 Tax=Manihot esculenta TaxID=3983 RepID=A0A2C9VUI8_MANES|nr:uncharacterized protein LOC110615960 [Manihot esculenta]OAY49221.1 hypothetical protein MANES_05G038600v8 [Manihot esculenta]
MAKISASSSSSSPTVSKDLPPHYADAAVGFLIDMGISDEYHVKDLYSDLFRSLLKTDHVGRGHVSCVFSVLPAVANFYDGLHGGAIGAIAERVAIACARTVVAKDKELFLGELGISYLSAAPLTEVVVVDGSVVRSGRNLTVVAIEFRIKKSKKLLYIARATLYHMPIAKL